MRRDLGKQPLIWSKKLVVKSSITRAAFDGFPSPTHLGALHGSAAS